jgi:3-hydroxybutyryl-CoA dehydrogenase
VEFRRISIVGGGALGRSLAQKVAACGIDVGVLEVNEEAATRSRGELVTNLDDELRKWGITVSEKKAILGRITFTTDPAAMGAGELLVEAVGEDLALKQAVMLRMDAICAPETIFITSTSTLSVTEIGAASGRADRVVGMHFMQPVTRSPIVEMVRGTETSDESFARATAFAATLDKTVIEVFEYPGYVVTRAIVPFANEAMHIVMEGVASADDVDLALRLGYEFKIGPLEYADRVGLDTMLGWMDHLFRELGDLKYRPCPLLRQMVRAGRLGRKTGRGFFTYTGNERVRSAKEQRR